MAVGKKGPGRERGSPASLGTQFFHTETFPFLPFYLLTDFMDSLHFRDEYLQPQVPSVF